VRCLLKYAAASLCWLGTRVTAVHQLKVSSKTSCSRPAWQPAVGMFQLTRQCVFNSICSNLELSTSAAHISCNPLQVSAAAVHL
jgi:hypothetical protein